MFDLLNEMSGVLRGTLGSPWLWVIVVAVSGLDALLPFMPSETTVVTVAVLIGPDPPRLAALAVVAALGAWSGDCLSHWVGRGTGPAMLARLQRGERGRARYEWARDRVAQHSALLIIAARYLPGGRVASGLATGSMGVSWPRFIALDALGAGIWAVYSVCIGCVGGTSFAGQPGKGLVLAFALGLAMVGAIAAGRRLRSRYAARAVRGGDRQPVHSPALRGD